MDGDELSSEKGLPNWIVGWHGLTVFHYMVGRKKKGKKVGPP